MFLIGITNFENYPWQEGNTKEKVRESKVQQEYGCAFVISSVKAKLLSSVCPRDCQQSQKISCRANECNENVSEIRKSLDNEIIKIQAVTEMWQSLLSFS